jgi:uncharacterized protein YlxW (UPF0749 family)
LRAQHVGLRLLPDKQPEGEHDLLLNPASRLFLMPRISIAILLVVMPLALLSSAAQAPAPREEQQQLLALVKEVQAQQEQIVANQTKIDAKLADLAETLHTARIFSSRSR